MRRERRNPVAAPSSPLLRRYVLVNLAEFRKHYQQVGGAREETRDMTSLPAFLHIDRVGSGTTDKGASNTFIHEKRISNVGEVEQEGGGFAGDEVCRADKVLSSKA